MDMIEVRPLKAFVGSYKCALADADQIDDQLDELPDGAIVKRQVPRKRFVGLISTHRRLRSEEIQQFIAGELSERLEVPNGKEILAAQQRKPQSIAAIEISAIEHPVNRTIMVPSDTALSLISRGLAEAVAVPKRRGAVS